jgi:hypothetical protein
MKRLQVGDECYVRNGAKDLYRAEIIKLFNTGIEFFIPHVGYSQRAHSGHGPKSGALKENQWSLVYPYPIIKQLAK